MANPFDIKLQGLKELQRKLKRAPDHIKEEIGAEIDASAFTIAGTAAQLAPADTGLLRQGITPSPGGKAMRAEVASNALYSPYVEFGTGGLVNVPVGLEDYAIQFKGKGIRQVNLPARPFFFPAIEKERPELIKRVQNILADL